MQAKLNNQTVFTGNISEFESAGQILADQLNVNVDDFELVYSPSESVSIVRQKIQQTAGDTDRLLGTTSDTTHLLLYGFATLIASLHSANAFNSLSKLREATAPFANLSSDFLAKVESGAVKLPFIGKGLENVIAEIEQRATAVAEVFAPGSQLGTTQLGTTQPADQATGQSSSQAADRSTNQASSQDLRGKG